MSMRSTIKPLIRPLYPKNIRKAIKRSSPKAIYLPLRTHNCKKKKSLSQAGQDFWVFSEVFNGMENGFFLEIGAADGIYLNNTFLLEKRYHWRGICIEANPDLFRDLQRVRSATCLNTCIDSVAGKVSFAKRSLYGGIIDVDMDNKQETHDKHSTGMIRMKTETLASVLKRENAPETIDYLSIDVEGAEDRILCDFPFDEFRFNCMTVERPREQLRKVLSQNGYILVKEIPNLDVFYIHESIQTTYGKNTLDFWKKYS